MSQRPSKSTVRQDATLRRWDEIAEEGWESILIGNGASIAVWDRFAYKSLYGFAASTEGVLSEEQIALFESIGTQDFEIVLSYLHSASIVAQALKGSTDTIEYTMTCVAQSLIQAVQKTHIPAMRVDYEHIGRRGAYLASLTSVFTTNYDLLTYWSMAECGWSKFGDYFSGSKFDPYNNNVPHNAASVYFLHGGIHLMTDEYDRTYKITHSGSQNILDQFETKIIRGHRPLFVTAGNHKEKLRTIERSHYLSFAFSEFVSEGSPLVIFGHSLGNQDKHIVDAINKHNTRKLAISIMPRAAEEIKQKKYGWHERLKTEEIEFFDATTHPLGDPSHKVKDHQ